MEKYNNYLFLDIDGVLISTQSLIRKEQQIKKIKTLSSKVKSSSIIKDDFPICPIAISNLNLIIDNDPHLKLIISSTLRIGYPLKTIKKYLKNKGFFFSHKIVDTTPIIDKNKREVEILNWLEHKKYNKVIVLDDNVLTFENNNKFLYVRVNNLYGLSVKHSSKIIKFLTGNEINLPRVIS